MPICHSQRYYLLALDIYLLSECLRADTTKIRPCFSLITSSLMILKLKYRASRMGANLFNLILDERSEHKKTYERSEHKKTYERSEFRVSFFYDLFQVLT